MLTVCGPLFILSISLAPLCAKRCMRNAPAAGRGVLAALLGAPGGKASCAIAASAPCAHRFFTAAFLPKNLLVSPIHADPPTRPRTSQMSTDIDDYNSWSIFGPHKKKEKKKDPPTRELSGKHGATWVIPVAPSPPFLPKPVATFPNLASCRCGCLVAHFGPLQKKRKRTDAVVPGWRGGSCCEGRWGGGFTQAAWPKKNTGAVQRGKGKIHSSLTGSGCVSGVSGTGGACGFLGRAGQGNL